MSASMLSSIWTHFFSELPEKRQRHATCHRRRRISTPAAIASMASAVVAVVESRMLSSGKSPVRINQIASRIIPRFLPARVLVILNLFPSSLETRLFEPDQYYQPSDLHPTLIEMCESRLTLTIFSMGTMRACPAASTYPNAG